MRIYKKHKWFLGGVLVMAAALGFFQIGFANQIVGFFAQLKNGGSSS